MRPDDIKAIENIYGMPYQLLRGKMLRKRPIRHERSEIVPVPTMIATRYKQVQIFMDIFFVNKLVFLHTKSENINYRSVQALKSRNTTAIIQGINVVKNKYETRGF